MRFTLKTGNILDHPADVLICSANPHLTLSGGVGADLLERYGRAMPDALAVIVKERDPHFIPQGEVIAYTDESLPHLAVFHAVAIDGWYDSSPTAITQITSKALNMAAQLGAKSVSLTALATGFGHLSLAEFADGLRPLLNREFPPVAEVCICLLEEFRLAELAKSFPEADVIS